MLLRPPVIYTRTVKSVFFRLHSPAYYGILIYLQKRFTRREVIVRSDSIESYYRVIGLRSRQNAGFRLSWWFKVPGLAWIIKC